MEKTKMIHTKESIIKNDMYIPDNANICGEYEQIIPLIEPNRVDMVLVDLPYGVTSAKWDVKIDLIDMWIKLDKVCKDNAIMVFTATEPFGSEIIQSNKKNFRYDIIWERNYITRPLSADIMPLRKHENILIFYNKLGTYNPQFSKGKAYKRTHHGKSSTGVFYTAREKTVMINQGIRHPNTIIKFSQSQQKRVHNSQKPVKLFEYLIKSYSNEGDMILDITAGSGTTAIAAINTNRKYIIIDKEEKYAKIAEERIEDCMKDLKIRNKKLSDLL